MPDSTIISGPFGSERVPVPGMSEPRTVDNAALPAEIDRVPFNNSSVAGDAGFREGQAARDARLYEADAGILGSVGAAVATWDTTRLVNRLSRPAFDEDGAEFNAYEALQQVPMVLSEDERSYYLEVARGPKSSAYAIEQITNLRDAHTAVGQHPAAAMLAAFADPLWLAVPPSIRLGKTSPAAGRLVSGAGSAAIAGAVTASGEGPVSDTDIVLNMVLNGAIGATLYKEGKLVPKDKEFPDRELSKIAVDLENKVKPDVTPPSTTTTAEAVRARITWRKSDAPENLPGGHTMADYLTELSKTTATDHRWPETASILLQSADPRVWDMPVRLSGSLKRAYVSEDGFAVLRKDSTPFVIVHEAVHVATLRQIETYLRGKQGMGPVTTDGARRLDGLYKELRKVWEAENGRKVVADSEDHVEYAFKDLHEFAAQAMSSPEFQKWLASKPSSTPGQSAWKSLIQIITRMLGVQAEGTKLNEVMDAMHTLLTARDTEFVEKSGKVSAYSPKQTGINVPVNTTGVSPGKIVDEVDKAILESSKKRGLGERLMWNMHKTMSSFGEAGQKIADLLYDNNADLSLTSVESHREAILSNLRAQQYKYEDLLRKAMAEDGYGIAKMVNPFTSRAAHQAQRKLERELQAEMFRREQANRTGVPYKSTDVPERITKMADALDALHADALQELKSAGVVGAEELTVRPGWVHRKWSSAAMDRAMDELEKRGLSRDKARSALNNLVSNSVRKATPMDKKIADQVGKAIVDRAMRKGYFEDAVMTNPAGEGQLKEMRDILKGSGLSTQDIERILDVMRIESDDAGKAGFLKHRMDLDYKTSMQFGDMQLSITDLIDNNLSTIVDQYVAQASTTAAFARAGLKKRGDIEALREELAHSITNEVERKQAVDLFDNTINHFRGLPAGGAVNEKFRMMQAYGRTIALAWSGMWQVTEFANVMAQYGLAKTLKYAIQEIQGFRSAVSPTKADAETLTNIIAEHSSQSMRLRPYIARFEDGFDMDTSSAMQLSLQTAVQLVPYANAMKFVHHAQAKVVGNLILDRLQKAAKGDERARSALAEYGLEAHVTDRIAEQIAKHGLEVDAWDDAVWQAARPAFAKMMDAVVLRGRLGDIPAFAAFDPIGKFIFTYRTFVLTAHNKVLAGMLERNGAGAVGLVMMYQFPLALAAVQAQSVVSGQGTLSDGDMIKKALGQMGGLGLFSEPLKWATGESNSIGAPGLIPIDRGVKLGQSVLHGDGGKIGAATISTLPIVSAIPFIRGIQNELKED